MQHRVWQDERAGVRVERVAGGVIFASWIIVIHSCYTLAVSVLPADVTLRQRTSGVPFALQGSQLTLLESPL